MKYLLFIALLVSCSQNKSVSEYQVFCEERISDKFLKAEKAYIDESGKTHVEVAGKVDIISKACLVQKVVVNYQDNKIVSSQIKAIELCNEECLKNKQVQRITF